MALNNIDKNINHSNVVVSEHAYQQADIAKQSEEPLHDAVMIQWANGLPESPNGILDLAAGVGKEVQLLSTRGFLVSGIDRDAGMINSRRMLNISHGNMYDVDLGDNQYSGFILKDVFIFIEPEKRPELLKKLHSALVPGGSVLIMSQLGDALRIFYNTGTAQGTAHETYSGDDTRRWKQIKAQIEKDGTKVFSVEHETTVHTIQDLANSNGFIFELVNNYSFDSNEAKERRWANGKSGFICTLTANK